MNNQKPLAWAAIATDASESLYLSVSRQAADRLCRTEGWTLVPLYAAQQDRVVRLPKLDGADGPLAIGWNTAIAECRQRLDAAGVKWEVADE